MDPSTLNTADWLSRLTALRLLWVCLVLAITAALTLVTAHAFIPSAIDSRTISNKWRKLRPVLYLVGIASFILEIILFVIAFSKMEFLKDIYPRFWI